MPWYWWALVGAGLSLVLFGSSLYLGRRPKE